MASSGNFCTWNPLNTSNDGGATTFTDGNLTCAMTGADPRTTGTIGGIVTDTDGFYFETVATGTGSGALTLGIVVENRHNQLMNGQIHQRSGSWMWRSYDSGSFFIETSNDTSYGTFADGDILGWFIKDNKLYVRKNNANVVGNPVTEASGLTLSGYYFFPALSRTVGGGSGTTSVLRPDADSWSYTPPSGFKGLTSKDMTINAGIDPAQTDENYGIKNCNVISYTGTGSSNARSGLGYKPDLVWIKDTGAAQDHKLTDSSRGVTKSLEANTNVAEATDSNGLTAFGTDGFTVGSDAVYNNSSANFVAWTWKCNGGTTATNTSGGRDSTVQVNQDNGFSIVQYAGGSATTIGHGLGVKPDLIFIKALSGTNDWAIYSSVIGATKYLKLNTNVQASTSSDWFSDTEPTTTVFSVGTNANVNTGGVNYVAYCWANKEGYFRTNSYIGDQDAFGTFVYTGIRPRILMLKRTDGNEDWGIYDSTLTPNNQIEGVLRQDANTSQTTSGRSIDFYASGFKLKTTNGTFNLDGGVYTYMCWGDSYKYNNTF